MGGEEELSAELACGAVERALGTLGWAGAEGNPWAGFSNALAPPKPHQANDPAGAALRALVKVGGCRMGGSATVVGAGAASPAGSPAPQ